MGKVASSIDCLQPYYFHIHLVGSEGSLLDNRIYSAKLPGMIKEKWSTLETYLIDSGDVSDHPYEPQFQAFIDSIGRGEPMPLTDFDTAFGTHRVVFAADRYSRQGNWPVANRPRFHRESALFPVDPSESPPIVVKIDRFGSWR